MAARGAPSMIPALAAVLVLGVLAGIAWAVLADDHSPADIWARATGASKPTPPNPQPDKLPDKPPDPPPKNGNPPVQPNGTESNLYAAAVMKQYRDRVETALFAGDFAAAEQAFGAIDTGRVPPDAREWHDQMRPRVAAFVALLRLTDDGARVPMPPLFEVVFADNTVKTVNVLRRTDTQILMEHFSGAVVGMAPGTLRAEPKLLSEDIARLDIVNELMQRAGKRQVTIKTSGGYAAAAAAGGAPSAVDYFDLADFANHWGLAPAVSALFEQAYASNPSVAGKVEEVKGRRLVKRFLHHFSLRQFDEARRVLAILNERFGRCEAFRELGDDQMAMIYKEATGKELKEEAPALAAAPPPTDPAPVVEQPDIETDSKDLSEAEKLVLKGDQAYREGMAHVERSSPTHNPDGADEENRKAMRKFQEARGFYAEAQEIYDNAGQQVPRKLMDKLREATSALFVCRKRAV